MKAVQTNLLTEAEVDISFGRLTKIQVNGAVCCDRAVTVRCDRAV